LSRWIRIGLGLGVALCIASPSSAVIDLLSDNDEWNPLSYLSTPDPSGDHGTGDPEGDIVGDTTDFAVYTRFDDGGTPLDKTDGTLAVRVRLSGDSSPAGWENFLVIGLDAGEDSLYDIDLFFGVDGGNGANTEIGIYDPGAGLNQSPSTTTLVSTPLVSYPVPPAVFEWTLVTDIDPDAVTTDFGADDPDQFLTFEISFADLVAYTLSVSGISIDDETALGFVVGTAKNANALNQDVGGSSGNWSDTTTWEALGAISNPVAPTNMIPVPEPDSLALALFGLTLLAGARRR